MKRLMAILAIVTLLSGCAIARGIKKYFCDLDVNATVNQLRIDMADVNSKYDFYVASLKGGNEKARPWVVAADGFLAQATPLVIGLQQGVCYATDMVMNAFNTYQATKNVQIK